MFMFTEERPSSRDRPQTAGVADPLGALYPLLLLVLCLFLYLWQLGVTPLEDFDEAYYAAGAREMLQRRDLGTPYFNGQPFLLKPILIYWAIAGSFSLFGATEFAARLPSAFFATFTVLATYWFTARLVSRRAGFLAGLSLALCYMWIEIARDASIDALLTFLLACAAFLFLLATRPGAPGRRWQLPACYALLGLGLLAKGPIPTGVVMIGVFAFVAASGRLTEILRRAQLLPGIALMVLVAGPWYWYESRHQPAFLATFFIGEHFGHVGGTLARQGPFWGNLEYLLIYFYPWVVFLPGALAHAFRQPRDHALRFAAWWAIAVVVLFSIPRSKLAHYLAPAFPALAILVGAWLDAVLASRETKRWPLVSSAVALGAAGAAFLALAVIAAILPPWVSGPIARQCGAWKPGLSLVVGLGFLGAGSCAGAALARHRPAAMMAAIAASMLLAGLTYVAWFKPHHAQIQAEPCKDLAEFAAKTLAPAEPLGVYSAKRNSTVFYFRRPIVDLGETADSFPAVVAFLSSPRPAALLTHARFLPDLRRRRVRVSVLRQRRDCVLISNRPAFVESPSPGPPSPKSTAGKHM